MESTKTKIVIRSNRPNHGEKGIWRVAQSLIEKLAKPNDDVVDLGAGTHRWAFRPKDNKNTDWKTPVRIDKSPKTDPHFVHNLNNPLPFVNDNFDGCLAMEIIEHLENPFAFLREVFRITKRWIVLSTPNPDTENGRLWLTRSKFYSHGHIMHVPWHLVEYVAIECDWCITHTLASNTGANYIVSIEPRLFKTPKNRSMTILAKVKLS